MAPPVEINHLATIVAAIASIVIGFIWYGPLFGKSWVKAVGLTPKQMKAGKKKGMAKGFIGMIIVSLVLAYVLSVFIDYAQAVTVGAGLLVGLLVWLGFMATIQIGVVLWEQKPPNLFIINTGFSLVELLVMSAIITAWV